jgi:hypothetical protein
MIFIPNRELMKKQKKERYRYLRKKNRKKRPKMRMNLILAAPSLMNRK